MSAAKKILAAISPSESPKVPTNVGDGKPGSWIICTTPLSCGLRVLEGWSEGIGIPSNANSFEDRFFTLLYYSANQAKYPHEKWNLKSVGGETMAPIGVGRYRSQFLEPNRIYVGSSMEKWIDRFEAFVNKYDLGKFSRSFTAKNISFSGTIGTITWQWNGKVPPLKDFAHVKVVE